MRTGHEHISLKLITGKFIGMGKGEVRRESRQTDWRRTSNGQHRQTGINQVARVGIPKSDRHFGRTKGGNIQGQRTPHTVSTRERAVKRTADHACIEHHRGRIKTGRAPTAARALKMDRNTLVMIGIVLGGRREAYAKALDLYRGLSCVGDAQSPSTRCAARHPLKLLWRPRRY